MGVSLYHKLLRVSLVIASIMLLFDGGFVMPITKEFSDNTLLYLASTRTSVVANVPENELNIITTELARRERELDARESALREREIDARDFGQVDTDYSTYILSVLIFILTALIVLNYFLDYMRLKKTSYGQTV